MAPLVMKALTFLAAASAANAYWLMGANNIITTQRMDPIVSPGKIAGHVHSVVGGSNFAFDTNTAALRNSECTSIPIPQDKSNYWFPHLYFQWANGSLTSLTGGVVIYYLFDDKPGTTTAFPDDFRMLSGDPTLRSYDSSSFAQQAVTFLCLDFNGKSVTYNSLPNVACPSGVRAQINFPSCWDGKNVDSADHKSHVAFRSEGADKGTCKDPNFPITLPRIFMEVYWATNPFDNVRNQAMNKDQPFVFANGDPTGYGYHADFFNGWDKGVLQNAVDKCNCNPFGDPTCCAERGIFDLKKGGNCFITNSIDETVTGTLAKLPGNNPVRGGPGRAATLTDTSSPAILAPVYAYTGNTPPGKGQVVKPAGPAAPASDFPSATSAASSSLSIQPSAAPSNSPSNAPVNGGVGPLPAPAPSSIAIPAASTAPAAAPSKVGAAPAASSNSGSSGSGSGVTQGASPSNDAPKPPTASAGSPPPPVASPPAGSGSYPGSSGSGSGASSGKDTPRPPVLVASSSVPAPPAAPTSGSSSGSGSYPGSESNSGSPSGSGASSGPGTPKGPVSAGNSPASPGGTPPASSSGSSNSSSSHSSSGKVCRHRKSGAGSQFIKHVKSHKHANHRHYKRNSAFASRRHLEVTL